MARPPNCTLHSGQFPLSSEVFQVFQAQVWLFLIPTALGLVQLSLFLEQTGFFLRRLGSSRRTSLSLWILGVYPVFSIMSLIGMYIPRSSFVCNFVANIYHSITLWKFLNLVTDFFGGTACMIRCLEGQHVAPNPFPCCCCCCLPNISTSWSNLRWMTLAVYQLSLIRTILFFITLILWTEEKYNYGDVSYTNPNSYINAIICISTFLSFYGYLLFYTATKSALPGYSLRSKFICIILVLVVCGLQSSILETMGALGAIPCRPPLSADTRSQIIYYYSLVVEMFLISLFARYCFRRVELTPESPLSTKNQASQTQAASGGSREDSASLTGLNPCYSSDESFCRIEHTPLDHFSFSPGLPLPAKGLGRAGQQGLPQGPSRWESWVPRVLQIALPPGKPVQLPAESRTSLAPMTSPWFKQDLTPCGAGGRQRSEKDSVNLWYSLLQDTAGGNDSPEDRGELVDPQNDGG